MEKGFRGRGVADMPQASARAWTDQLQSLFDDGTCTGLSDGELIERFLGCRDEGGNGPLKRW